MAKPLFYQRRECDRLCSDHSAALLLLLVFILPAALTSCESPGNDQVAATAAPVESSTESLADPLKIQASRTSRITKRGEIAHYAPDRFNLDDLPPYVPRQEVSGTIRAWGSNYIETGNLAKYWESAFREFHPQISFEYFLPTALVGIPGLYMGKADIAPSRPITFDEMLSFQRVKGYHPLEITVATGSFNVPGWAPSLVVVVHKDNPLKQLTMDQIDGIFGAERMGAFDETFSWQPGRARGPEKNIRVWGELGLTGEWADAEITPYGLSLNYHQQSRIEKRAFQGSNKWNEKLREYAHYTDKDGNTVVSNDQLLKDLGKDKFGIGYTNYGYLTADHEVNTIALSRGENGPFVVASIDTVRDRSYPLYGQSFIYVDRKPGERLDPKVEEFLRFVLSREGQQALVKDGKYLPLTSAIVMKQLEKLD